jgi:hypothetical protein
VIHHGDCVEVMAGMEPESVGAIVTDPPYGLEFMGMAWDQFDGRTNGTPRPRNEWGDFGSREHARGQSDLHRVTRNKALALQAFSEAWAREALRVAKPGAYLLAFGGTRTVHRLACAIEDAGWIIRDQLAWCFASGFPKSRASLKPAFEPIVLARKPGPLRDLAIDACRIGSGPTATMEPWDDDRNLCGSCVEDAGSPARPGAPATRGSITPRRAAPQQSGSATSGGISKAGTGCSHGTTLVSEGFSSSTDEFGRTPTGLFPSDSSSTTSTRTSSTTGSRTCICCGGPITRTTTSATRFDIETGLPVATTSGSTGGEREPLGRWPSNLVLTDPIFDGGIEGVVGGGETGPAGTAVNARRDGVTDNGVTYGYFPKQPGPDVTFGDNGTYSRFFLVPKSDRTDREPILGIGGEAKSGERVNVHPTQP